MSGHEWVVIINPDRYEPTYHADGGDQVTKCGAARQAWHEGGRDPIMLRWQHAAQFAVPCRTCYRRCLR